VTRLCEKSLVKDLLGINRHDLLLDKSLASFIDAVSSEAEQYCSRSFTKASRVATAPRYEQHIDDPDPQFIWLEGPIAQSPAPQIWLSGWTTDTDIVLEGQHFEISYELGLIKVMPTFVGLRIDNASYIPSTPGFLDYSASGWKVAYTGGYDVSVRPTGDDPDPSDDYGVVQVPEALKVVIATETVRRWRTIRGIQQQTPAQMQNYDWRTMLNPWRKKDHI
jgi:hypothetical protein